MYITTMWVGDDAMWVGGTVNPKEDDPDQSARLARWDGKRWMRSVLNAPGVLAVEGHRGALWATGLEGQIWSLQRGAWRVIWRRLEEGQQLTIGTDGDVWVAGKAEIAHRGPGDGRQPWLDAPLHGRGGLVVALDAGDDGTIGALVSPRDQDDDRLEIWDRDRQRFVPNDGATFEGMEVMAIRSKDDVVIGGLSGVHRWDGQRWNPIMTPSEIYDVRALAYRGREVVIVGRAKSGTGVRVVGDGPSPWQPLKTDPRDVMTAGPNVLAVGPDGTLWVADGSQGTVWFHRP